MKRTLAGFLVLLIVFSAACGGNVPSAQVQGTAEPSPAETAAPTPVLTPTPVPTPEPTPTQTPDLTPKPAPALTDGPLGNTNGNLSGGGHVAQQDGWVYFSYYWYHSQGIYKVELDGTKIIKISDTYAGSLNVVGEWIYFRACGEDGAYGIYKMKTDGESMQRLGNDKPGGFIVVGNWIYYGSGGICRMDVNGENRTQITDEPIWDFNIQGDFIYYSTSDYDRIFATSIYKVKTDGTGRQEIFTGTPPKPTRGIFIDNILIMGDWIYYLSDIDDNDGLYRTKTDGSQETELLLAIPIIHSAVRINILDDTLYLLEGDKITKMKFDGSKQKKLSLLPYDVAEEIYLFDNWIWLEYSWESDYGDGYKMYKMKPNGTKRQTIIEFST